MYGNVGGPLLPKYSNADNGRLLSLPWPDSQLYLSRDDSLALLGPTRQQRLLSNQLACSSMGRPIEPQYTFI
jgi:hypothetical protein